MKINIKNLYKILTIIFSILTSYELYIYMTMNSNYFGLLYLIINLFIMFLLFTITINYNKSIIKLRISKNIMAITFGFISSFLLYLILKGLFTYSDESYIYIKRIFLSIKVLKPIIYLLISGITYLDFKKMQEQSNN